MNWACRSTICIATLSLAGCGGSAGNGLEQGPSQLSTQLADTEANILHHEELVADCMIERGFDYLAVVPNDFLIERAESKAAAAGQEFNMDSLDLPANPNDEIVGHLSPSDRDAYIQALWAEDSGCYARTYEEAWGPSIEQVLTIDDQLEAELDNTVNESRVWEAGQTYLECMSSAGFPEVLAPAGAIELTRSRTDEAQLAIEAGGRTWEGSPEQEELDRWAQALLQTDLECSAPYLDLLDDVRNEILERHGS